MAGPAARRWISALCLSTLVLGCGSAPDEASTTDGGPPPPVGGTFATLTAAGNAGGAAIVVSTDDGGGPTTTLWLAEDDRGLSPTVVPSTEPLYAISTWFAGDRVAVMGAACASWTSGPAPRWVDEREGNVPVNCGGVDYELWLWDPPAARWDEVPTPTLDSQDGYALVTGHGAAALLLRRGPGSPELFVLDVESGATTPLPAPPATDGSAEARFTPCLNDEAEAFGLLTWGAEAPVVVTSAGWADAAAPQGDGAGHHLVLAPRGGGWEPVASEGTVTSWSGVTGCGPTGIWAGRPETGGTVRYRGGAATISPLPPLPVEVDPSREVSMDGSKGDGTALAVVRDPPGEAPDRPREATAFALDGASWRSVPAVPLGPGSSPFLDGDGVASLDLGPGAFALEVTLPDRP